MITKITIILSVVCFFVGVAVGFFSGIYYMMLDHD